MIIEWIINALISIIKAPISLLNLPNYDVSENLATLTSYAKAGACLIRLFLPDFAFDMLLATMAVLALAKVFDLISTIVGFFKNKGGEKN